MRPHPAASRPRASAPPPAPRRRTSPLLIAGGALAALLLVVGGAAFIKMMLRDALGDVDNWVDSYLSDKGLTEEAANPLYRRGQVVVIDAPKKRVHGMQSHLGDLRALRDDQVGTVVRLDCSSTQPGPDMVEERTRATIRSVLQACSVILIDWAEKKIIGRTTLVATPHSYANGGFTSEDPVITHPMEGAEVEEFLRALPVR